MNLLEVQAGKEYTIKEIVTDDEEINLLRGRVEGAIKALDDKFRIHDFRCVSGPTHTNLIFDIEIPFEEKKTNKEIVSLVETEIKKLDQTYFAVISIDRV